MKKSSLILALDEMSSRLIGAATIGRTTAPSGTGQISVRETAKTFSDLTHLSQEGRKDSSERLLKRSQSKISSSRLSRDQGSSDQPVLRRNQSRKGLTRKASQVFRNEDSSPSDESLEVESPKEVSIYNFNLK